MQLPYDPLGQTHSRDHYFYLKMVLFHEILKSGNGRVDKRKHWCVKIVITTEGRPRGSIYDRDIQVPFNWNSNTSFIHSHM